MDEKGFADDAHQLADADLLPHEFTHSWNGKYRRPVGLYQPDFATPQQGALLWVYEGMTQYLGNVLAARSGLETQAQYRDMLAIDRGQPGLYARPRVALDGGHGRRRQHPARRQPGVVELEARAGLLPGGRAAVARCRHAHPQADAEQEIAGRLREDFSRQGRKHRPADRDLQFRRAGRRT